MGEVCCMLQSVVGGQLRVASHLREVADMEGMHALRVCHFPEVGPKSNVYMKCNDG